VRRVLWFIAGGLLGLVASALVFCVALLSLLRPAPGEWAQPVRMGPWQVSVSVPAAVRMATHPVLMRWLADRSWHTALGPVQWHALAPADGWRVSCSPCRVRVAELGADEIVLTRVELQAHRSAQNAWRGEFSLGDAPHAVRGRFVLGFDAHGAQVDLTLPDTPLADAYALFAAGIPELARARIDGRIRLEARWMLPQRTFSVRPQIEGFAVAGLGTEALLNAAPACDAAPQGFGSWLPRAVIAAEDQRFYEHSGYDLREIAAAWSGAHGPGDPARGASTLSQQVAKLLYAGDEHSHLRKLRELLYAVELDRTLGKARVLNLYLAIAPWGEGRCGATSAARHYLHKRVDRLTPMEAAWLASLLHNPDQEWRRCAQSGQVNTERVGWVIANLRPMRASRREALVQALPDWAPPRH